MNTTAIYYTLSVSVLSTLLLLARWLLVRMSNKNKALKAEKEMMERSRAANKKVNEAKRRRDAERKNGGNSFDPTDPWSGLRNSKSASEDS